MKDRKDKKKQNSKSSENMKKDYGDYGDGILYVWASGFGFGGSGESGITIIREMNAGKNLSNIE